MDRQEILQKLKSKREELEKILEEKIRSAEQADGARQGWSGGGFRLQMEQERQSLEKQLQQVEEQVKEIESLDPASMISTTEAEIVVPGSLVTLRSSTGDEAALQNFFCGRVAVLTLKFFRPPPPSEKRFWEKASVKKLKSKPPKQASK